MTIKDGLHIHDLSLDGQELRKQLIENFDAIEKAINDLRGQIDKVNKELNKQDDIYNAGGGM